MRSAVILDCYTVEPSGLGVPPYLSTYVRDAWSALHATYRAGEVRYLTIDDVRWALNGGEPLAAPPVSDPLTSSNSPASWVIAAARWTALSVRVRHHPPQGGPEPTIWRGLVGSANSAITRRDGGTRHVLDQTVGSWLEDLASDAPAPGGGAAAAMNALPLGQHLVLVPMGNGDRCATGRPSVGRYAGGQADGDRDVPPRTEAGPRRPPARACRW